MGKGTRGGTNNSHLFMHSIFWYHIIIRYCSVVNASILNYCGIEKMFKTIKKTSTEVPFNIQ